VSPEGHKSARLVVVLAISLYLFLTIPAQAQQVSLSPEVPDKFTWDLQTAARLRAGLRPQSAAVSSRYATGELVFERLLEQVQRQANVKFSWELRLLQDDSLNAYSSADGAIYVERGLANLAGSSAGLWAAILSHEIAHVVRRDWARRYLYEKSLAGGGTSFALGDPGAPNSTWMDSRAASEELARFCRQMELEADREGLVVMARAGYHPDFVPALHHLLHAQSVASSKTSLTAMHPCWETRDRELGRAYVSTSIEFDRRWPDRFASPGGNPPLVVFADEPVARKTGGSEWEILMPLRCQNLAGVVEVVLRERSSRGDIERNLTPQSASSTDVRQLTGCTSPRSTVTFSLSNDSDKRSSSPRADVFVLDSQGLVLSRAEVNGLRR
jgi:hypothetical protein